MNVETNKPRLVFDQKLVYDTITQHVVNEKGGILFLDVPGGIEKNITHQLALLDIRKDNSIGLLIASSGIVATLLPSRRAVHSVLKLPLNFATSNASICNISKNSGQERVLKSGKVIISMNVPWPTKKL